MIRTIDEWRKVFDQAQFKTATLEQKVKRILGDVAHYRHGCRYEADDVEQIANAILAIMNPR